MIDVANENLIGLSEVPKLLPKRSNGKRIHISAIYRWAQKGIRGIRLETLRLGGTTYTSREAIQRFADSQTANATSVDSRNSQLTSRTRIYQADKAEEKVLKVLGIIKQKKEK